MSDWFDTGLQSVGMYLDGRGIRTRGPNGEAVVDDSFLLVLHTGPADVDLVLPAAPWASWYELVVNTGGYPATIHQPGSSMRVGARSVLLLRALRPLPA